MRQECKNYQSRTYDTGDVARYCVLGLAPEAPWKCPDNCPKYERRLADVGWQHGKLVSPPVVPIDIPQDEERDIEELLNRAEDVVNSAVFDTMNELKESKKRRGLFRRKDRD
ncbi:hypothetical protein [Acidithrix sp. C25]|nr:hypothetical protein [Acidithrix sp. C25]